MPDSFPVTITKSCNLESAKLGTLAGPPFKLENGEPFWLNDVKMSGIVLFIYKY